TTMTVLMLSASFAIAGTSQEAAILKVHEDFAASWNKNDYKAMASMFADDADLINPLGRHASGKAEIEKLYQDEQTGTFKGSHFTSDCKSGVRMVKPDVAVVTCAFEVTDGKLPDGKAMPALKGIYTATMLKVKSKWVVVAGRPMIPFTPPTPPPAKK
ncbi:MAG TPA: SgcJ/EcaC family oxidoreductase, partial [Kofleriaceae bacterium]|nr:SgcJ/EcaC family oxidoreductase [Kofleriaceae bacterium]